MSELVFVRSSFCSRNGCVEVAQQEDGTFAVRDRKGVTTAFSREEWDEFIAGVKAGEFDF